MAGEMVLFCSFSLINLLTAGDGGGLEVMGGGLGFLGLRGISIEGSKSSSTSSLGNSGRCIWGGSHEDLGGLATLGRGLNEFISFCFIRLSSE